MRYWTPQSSIGRWFAILLLIVVSIGGGILGQRLTHLLAGTPEDWPINLQLYSQVLLFVGLTIFAGALLYRILATFTLRYVLDRNGLYVTWLGNRAVIPLDSIQSVDIGITGYQKPRQFLGGIGSYWGQSDLPDGKKLHLFATQPLSKCLVIQTANDLYVISPADHAAFVQDLEQRRNLGATKPLSVAVEPSRMFLYAFWNDRTIRALLLITFVINLAVVAVIAGQYPNLDTNIEMRFDAIGEVTAVEPRHQILFLPLAALSLSLLNIVLGLFLYQSQQLGARLLQGTSVIVQILFGIAIITILR
ncbi:MAG: PH domain-containing protein [Chloroflexota bacterium]